MMKNTFIAAALLVGTVFVLYGNKQLIPHGGYKRDIVVEQIRSGTLGRE